MERSLALSREEQEELARSNKKVKTVSHASFHEGQESTPSTPSQGYSPWNCAALFKDKLVGDIPGAFTQAFSFGDLMEDDMESDDEVEALREGLLAVTFSKDLKQRIRTPWAKALIVKVYGRSVVFNYLHNRLLSLWKLAGRLDCVDLGSGFFLTRFYLREVFETVLKKGPWFIGEHFLSIRLWEPNFHPATANVSSIAVWIRLNGLPIEYYHAEALHQIGKTIGNVLRVDTHTASETRGRFARLCVQVDVNKLLATAILIGKFEQSICYEGERELGSCNERVADNDKPGQGPTESVLANEEKGGTEGRYGPWVVVTHKKNETKSQRSGGASLVQGSGQPQQRKKRSDAVLRMNFVPCQTDASCETARDGKHNLDGSVRDSVVTEPNWRAQVRSGSSPKVKDLDLANTRFYVDLSKPNPSVKSSVKGMKALARLRTSQSSMVSAVGETSSACRQSKSLPHDQVYDDVNASRGNVSGHQEIATTQFHFSSSQQVGVGQLRRGNGSHNSGYGKPEVRTGQQEVAGKSFSKEWQL
nr:uncharacterized protein CFP56_40733 [Quercus suber]